MSFAFPVRNVLIVDLYPRVYFPDFTTRESCAGTFSVVFFLLLTIFSTDEERTIHAALDKNGCNGQIVDGKGKLPTFTPSGIAASWRG